jgi:hypothetical protein
MVSILFLKQFIVFSSIFYVKNLLFVKLHSIFIEIKVINGYISWIDHSRQYFV